MSEIKNKKYLPLLDGIRAICILMVVFYHYLQEFLGTGFLMVAQGIEVNLQRLQIFHGDWSWIKNALTIPFAYGYSAVNVFIILSGFVLTWGLVQNNSPEETNWIEFFWKKAKRILIPFYISVLVCWVLLAFRNTVFSDLSWWPNYNWFDFLKFLIPVFPIFDIHWLQQMNGDYWYLTLILQLYLVFPVLYWFLTKYGWIKFLITAFLLTITYRFLVTFGYDLLPFKIAYLDSSPMGVIAQAQNSYYGFSNFLGRLFEFSFGMGLAILESQFGILDRMRGGWKMIIFLLLTLIGYTLNYYQAGWITSDLVIGIGLLGFLLNLGAILQTWMGGLLKNISDYSFEMYLLHHYFLNFVFIPTLAVFGLRDEAGFWIFWPFYAVAVYLIGKYGFALSNLVNQRLFTSEKK